MCVRMYCLFMRVPLMVRSKVKWSSHGTFNSACITKISHCCIGYRNEIYKRKRKDSSSENWNWSIRRPHALDAELLHQLWKSMIVCSIELVGKHNCEANWTSKKWEENFSTIANYKMNYIDETCYDRCQFEIALMWLSHQYAKKGLELKLIHYWNKAET